MAVVVQASSAFYVLEVEILRRIQGVSAAVPRDQRLCGLCWDGVGDEMHMVAQCDGYTAVRQRHPHLLEELGGWQQVTDQAVSSQQFRRFMHQDPVKVASFLFECSQRRWENPPDELLFADCEKPDEASVVVEEGSEHYFDVYSEEFFDCEPHEPCLVPFWGAWARTRAM